MFKPIGNNRLTLLAFNQSRFPGWRTNALMKNLKSKVVSSETLGTRMIVVEWRKSFRIFLGEKRTREACHQRGNESVFVAFQNFLGSSNNRRCRRREFIDVATSKL